MNDLSNANDVKMEQSMSNSASSSSSISSMTSNHSDLDMIIELAAALDLNPDLLKSPTDDYLTKENLINFLRDYLQNEHQIKSKQDDEFKLNEMKTMLMLDGDLSKAKSSLKTIMEDENLPRNILITQMREEIFRNKDIKLQFEQLFQNLTCKFCYLSTFKRCYIEFENPVAAILARVQLHDQMFLNEPLNIFINKPIRLKNTRKHLEAPHSDKLFLISPPCSPPVGWEQEFEEPPIVNLDLLAALSELNPRKYLNNVFISLKLINFMFSKDEPCELIKSKDNMPSIVIHPCPDLDMPMDSNLKRKFMPTRRPANDCS